MSQVSRREVTSNSANPTRYLRRIIHIRGEDSPNVRYALEQQARGVPPDDRVILPGVLPYSDYVTRMSTWDSIRVCIGIHAQFYEGAETLLYPPTWLNHAEYLADTLRRAGVRRVAKAMGIDPAEGGDSTAIAVVDELGLIDLVSRKTPDTYSIIGEVKHLIRYYNVPHSKVMFDRGGGGKQLADTLRAEGGSYSQIRTVAFGEPPSNREPRSGMTPKDERREKQEDKYTYRTRRAEMYGTLRMLLDPSRTEVGETVFALPSYLPTSSILRQELAPIPLMYDSEGRLTLPPKHRQSGGAGANIRTLTDIIGHSPDHADALVIAIHAMLTKGGKRTLAGAAW